MVNISTLLLPLPLLKPDMTALRKNSPMSPVVAANQAAATRKRLSSLTSSRANNACSSSEGGSWYVLFNDGAGNQTKGDPGFVCENAAYYTVDGKDHIVTKTGAVESPIDGERIYSNGNAIFIASNKARKVAIYDITGRCVASVDAAAGTTMVSDLAPGIYFIENHKLIIK